METDNVSSALPHSEYYLIFIILLMHNIWLPYLLMHKRFLLFGINNIVHFLPKMNVKEKNICSLNVKNN